MGKEGDNVTETTSLLKKLIDVSGGDDAKMDDERVVGNLATMIMAGTDTTASILSVCLWEIANNRTLQKELQTEVDEVGLDLEKLTMDDVMTMYPRLHSLFYEVIRVKGPAAFLFLEPADNMEFRGVSVQAGTTFVALSRFAGKTGGAEIPKGTNGEGPDEFSPQRWLVEKDGVVCATPPSNKHGGYMGFGYGVRVCPGAKLAEAEAISCLVHILSKFEMMPAENHPALKQVTWFTMTYDKEVQLLLKDRVPSSGLTAVDEPRAKIQIAESA